MVERKEYLDQLWAWKDEQQIKVVTGIRRCGKSVLLEQYQQRLLANGVAPEQIISINFENLDYEPLKDYMRLYNYLKERLCVDKMTYIFLDEVQEVPSFEKVVGLGLIGRAVGFFLAADKGADLLNAFGVTGGQHLRHLDDPVALQLGKHLVIIQLFQVIREPLILYS